MEAAVYGGEMSPIRDMIGGALSSVGNGYIDEHMDDMVLKVASSAVLGGTISEIGGGKFANGAITGAYSMLFNEGFHSIQTKIKGLIKSVEREWFSSSKKWATNGNSPKCNIFAQDMMRENDMAPYDDQNLSAGTWGNSKSNIPGWKVVSDGNIQPGDVAAYKANYSNATGHMGIMVENKSRMFIVYAGSSQAPNQIVGSIFSNWKGPKWVIWRYVGK